MRVNDNSERERPETAPGLAAGNGESSEPEAPPDLLEPLDRSLTRAVEQAENEETRYHLRNALQFVEILRWK